MVGMNRAMDASVETVFMMADARRQAIASKLVKEIARLGGDVSKFVPPAVEAACITFPHKAAHRDTRPKVDNSSKSAPLTPILSNGLQIGMRATRAVSTFLMATPAQLARPNANWATAFTSRDKMRSSILTQAGIAALATAIRLNSQPCDGEGRRLHT